MLYKRIPLLLVLFGFALSASAEYQLLDRVVAVVEDDVVLASEVREEMQQLSSTLRQRGVAVPDSAALYERVLERAILERLQLQRGERMGLRITDQRLNEAMTQIASNNGLSLSDFRRLLLDNGDSYVDLREQVRREMVIREVQQRNVIRSININKSEVESFLASERGRALIQPEWQVDHLLLEVVDFDDSAEVEAKRASLLALREQAIAAGNFQRVVEPIRAAGVNYQPLGWLDSESLPTLFSAVIDELDIGEVSALIESDSGFHLIRLVDRKGGAVGDIRETKVRHILIGPTAIRSNEESRELLDEVRERIAAGEDFALLARQYSDDPGSALSGGDLGWVEPNMMVPEFENMMNEIEPQTVSPVFETTYGWHILEVLERRDRDGFQERARQLARQQIAESKYDDALQNWLQELRDNAYVEIK